MSNKGDIDLTATVNRLTAEHMLRRLEADEQFANEQLAAQSRWLNASLLAVNSAGLIAAVQVQVGQQSKWAIMAFVLGAGASLMSGAAIQEGYATYLPKALGKRRPYWTEVSLTGARVDDVEDAFRNEKGDWVDFVAPSLGWLSGVLWVVGAAVLAFR